MNLHSRIDDEAILIEKDVEIPMRDGALLIADVFRPKDGALVPALINLGPYQKDKLWIPPDTLEIRSPRFHFTGDCVKIKYEQSSGNFEEGSARTL